MGKRVKVLGTFSIFSSLHSQRGLHFSFTPGKATERFQRPGGRQIKDLEITVGKITVGFTCHLGPPPSGKL